jgi:hypothetical protein
MRTINRGRAEGWPLGELILILLPLVAAIYVFIVIKATDILYANSGNHDRQLIINLSIAIPEIIIWVIAALSSVKFKSYTEKIKDSPDGKALSYIADSLLFLTLYVIIRSTTGNVIALFKNTDSLNTIIYVENYLPLAIGLVSAALLLVGTIRLRSMVRYSFKKVNIAIIALLYLAVCIAFSWHFYGSFYQLVAQNGIPRFVGPRSLMMYTYVVPLMLKWGLLLAACVFLYIYSTSVTGLVYNRMFKNLYRGIVLVFIVTFLVQLIIDSNDDINKFNVPLLIIYLMLVLAVVGFIEIYRGASHLRKIEEV